ncbi:aminomethyltransferase family protein [Saccharomonospora xinjiangensis]|uniref:Glycine cleavage system T protein (Aminomethyltransferase) n=1 Tax=Saccharomonospora xinjiangensis XJ-54 TaxID=882086 RepID=I0V5H6_9PSEU|nr:glycine cleavage T C-terminal barrel domain-containing protein [Saccharomonospora xinjiangensis]EID55379.1 glycine cleavage system T protein (aminomethyltransferase) [Saccharomonospora xinjiangensis XJ-54]
MNDTSALTSPLQAAHPEGTVYDTVGEAVTALRYTTLEQEYDAIRNRAAVFDLSGARLIEVTGDGAVDYAQRVLARDVEYLTAERCMTSLVLDGEGAVVDTVVVWGREDGLLLESSVGMGGRLLEHLRAQAGDDVTITDRTGELVLLALEGPYAWGVVGRLIDGELAALPFESVVDTTWDGAEIVFARTGSTAEYGYQIIAPAESAERLWTKAVEQAVPAGYEALELAMLEVRQPVVRREATGADIVELGANWLVDITKDDFLGRDAVLAAFEAPAKRRTIGFSGGDSVPESGTPVTVDGEQVGDVVYAVRSVALGTILGLARIAPDLAAAGLRLSVGDAEVTTLTSPYITPKSWSTPII